MPGVPRNVIEHSLNVDPKATPKQQHLHRFADVRRDAIKKEFAKLLAAGFIREVFHPEWLTNPVLVRKKNSNEWRMCVDYTDLNKHRPKDTFGLPRVDQVIDSNRPSSPFIYRPRSRSGPFAFFSPSRPRDRTAQLTPRGPILSFSLPFLFRSLTT
jgi:hypothetical protein